MWWWVLLGYVPDELLSMLPMYCGDGYYWDTCLMSYSRCFPCIVVVVISGYVPDALLSVLPM